MRQDAVAHLLASAAAAQRGGNLEQAAATYHQVLRAAPEHPGALNSLGVLALDAGRTDEAIDYHRRAAAADAGAPVLWMNLAKAQRFAGDDSGERDSLDRALTIDALLFPALVRKAQLHERRGETALALAAWQGVLATAPDEGDELRELLDHARAFVAAQMQALASGLDAGLAAPRGAAQGSLRRFDACVAASTGRRRVYVNECAGLYFPFLPADEFFERAHFAWLPKLEAHTDAIAAELTALLATGAPGFAPYVAMEAGAPANKWTPLDGSTAWSAYYLWRYGARVENAHARCPETSTALADIPLLDLDGRGPNVFFSLLEPGARIPAHTGVTNIRAIVHLPLSVPDACAFRVGGETRAWRRGEAFAFDDTIEHEAWNDSDDLRAVLILDVWNPYLTLEERSLLREYFRIADAQGLNPGTVNQF